MVLQASQDNQELHDMRLVALRQACNQGNLQVVQRYMSMPEFFDNLSADDCAQLMAMAIHSVIYGSEQALEVMNVLATDSRFLALGPLGTMVVKKAMSCGNSDLTIHLLNNFELESTSICEGLVESAMASEWQAILEIFQFHCDEDQEEIIICFEAGALRDLLILVSASQRFDLFWQAVEIARNTESVDLVQWLHIINDGMAASKNAEQLAAFVNLLMSDANEYITHLSEHDEIVVPLASQFLRQFVGRDVIMKQTGLSIDLGNEMLDVGFHLTMHEVLFNNLDESKNNKDKNEPKHQSASSDSSDDEASSNSFEELDKPIMVVTSKDEQKNGVNDQMVGEMLEDEMVDETLDYEDKEYDEAYHCGYLGLVDLAPSVSSAPPTVNWTISSADISSISTFSTTLQSADPSKFRSNEKGQDIKPKGQ